MKLTIAIAAIASVAPVCTAQQLTRPQALKLLKSHTYEPTDSIQLRIGANMHSDEREVESLQRLVKAGWVNLQIHAQQNYGRLISISMTDRGIEQSRTWTKIPRGVSGPLTDDWKIVLATREVVEVTGITSPMPSYAEVDYTWRSSPTKAGQLLGVLPGTAINGKAHFVKYDDGWRVGE